MLETAIVEAPQPEQLEDTNEAWIEALPARVYHIPEYGEVPITRDKLQRFITNFRQNVRGQEIATDYEHGLDTAKGRQASGWYRDFDIRPSSDDPNQESLYAKVEFTEDAKKDIRDKKYRYWSLEWDDEYETDSKQIVPDVVIGGGLTNRPVAKRTMPITFSEQMWNDLSDEDKKYAARLVRERRLLSELNPESRKALNDLISKGFQIRLSEAAMEHSDPGIAAPIYEADNQPDPGTGQHVPRVTGDPSRNDPAIAGGWRRDPLPVVNPKEEGDPIAEQESREHTNVQLHEKGGNTVAEFKFTEENIGEIRTLLDLDDKADGDTLVESVRNAFSELKTFKETVGESGKEKQFAEMFPQQYKQHMELLETNRANAAKTFSENNARINKVVGTEGDTIKTEPTRSGLSALALETVADKHKKFAEGIGTLEDFEEAVKTITNGGVVEFGEVGSSNEEEQIVVDGTTVQGIANARKLFAEKVSEVQTRHAKENNGEQLDILVASAKASELYPDLAKAYRATAA